jgi:hypothetical protein
MDTTGFLYDNLAPAQDDNLNSYNMQEMILNSLKTSYNSVNASDNEINSYVRVSLLRDKFVAFMNKKNASIFDFLKNLLIDDTLTKALNLVNRFENQKYKENVSIVNHIEANLNDAKEWLDSILLKEEASPSQLFKKNINMIIESWIETMNQLDKNEELLKNKVTEIQSIQKKIEVMQLLPVNDNLVPVLESLEKYIESAYKELELKKYFEDCLNTYKRVYVLQNLMSYIRVTNPSTTLPLCPICFDQQINMCLVPCGHTFCSECVGNNIRFQCAVCRTNITNKQKIFFN